MRRSFLYGCKEFSNLQPKRLSRAKLFPSKQQNGKRRNSCLGVTLITANPFHFPGIGKDIPITCSWQDEKGCWLFEMLNLTLLWISKSPPSPSKSVKGEILFHLGMKNGSKIKNATILFRCFCLEVCVCDRKGVWAGRCLLSMNKTWVKNEKKAHQAHLPDL